MRKQMFTCVLWCIYGRDWKCVHCVIQFLHQSGRSERFIIQKDIWMQWQVFFFFFCWCHCESIWLDWRRKKVIQNTSMSASSLFVKVLESLLLAFHEVCMEIWTCTLATVHFWTEVLLLCSAQSASVFLWQQILFVNWLIDSNMWWEIWQLFTLSSVDLF